MKLELCKICNESFSQKSGHFTVHLKKYHNLTLENYVVWSEFNNVHPKCQCGFCDDDSSFNDRSRTFLETKSEHKKYDWLKKMKILKFGEFCCLKCGDIVKWVRGIPKDYCQKCCQIENIRKKYGVDNVFQIPNIIEKIKKKVEPHRKERSIKCNNTKKLKYKNGAFDSIKFKETMIKNYGVEYPSQISKNRKNSSIRMTENNPLFDTDNVEKMIETRIKRFENGDFKFFNTKKYNDDLYYQGTYEKDFLDLCNDIGIINNVKNGNSFKYLDSDKNIGHRTITDFSYNDIEIEIKSNWILEKQGGYEKIEAKKRAVEKKNKKYMLILDKNYTEFLKIILSLKK